MTELLWDAANITHIARHDLTPDQIQQVFEMEPFEVARYRRNGEERLNYVGETLAGEVLVVVTTVREGALRIVTAHPADRSMRKKYAQWKEEEDNAKSAGDARLQN